jgi:hypothetical protein
MGKNEWWKKALVKKYLEGDMRRCLDAPLIRKEGSPIWKMIRVSHSLLLSSLHWVPRNDKLINIW